MLDLALDALISSIRPLGLNKKKFIRTIRELSQQDSNIQTKASSHATMLEITEKILSRGL